MERGVRAVSLDGVDDHGRGLQFDRVRVGSVHEHPDNPGGVLLVVRAERGPNLVDPSRLLAQCHDTHDRHGVTSQRTADFGYSLSTIK